MKIKLHTLLILFALLMVQTSFAQTDEEEGNYAEKTAAATKGKVQNRADQELNNEIDKNIDKAFGAIKGLFSKKNKKNKNKSVEDVIENNQMKSGPEVDGSSSSDRETQGRGLSGFGMVSLNNVYNFNKVYKYNFVTTHKRKVHNNNMLVLANSDVDYVVGLDYQADNKDDGMTMIADVPNGLSLMLMEKGKSGQVFNSKLDLSDYEVEEEMGIDNFTFEKTGNTETILGYHCEEYTFRDDKYSGTFWLTDDVEFNYIHIFTKSFVKFGNKMEAMRSGTKDRMIVKLDSKSHNGKSSTSMQLVEVNDVDITFNLAEYELMKL